MNKQLCFIFFVMIQFFYMDCFSQNRENRNDFLYPQIYGTWDLEGVIKNEVYPHSYYNHYRFRKDGSVHINVYKQMSDFESIHLWDKDLEGDFWFENDSLIVVSINKTHKLKLKILNFEPTKLKLEVNDLLLVDLTKKREYDELVQDVEADVEMFRIEGNRINQYKDNKTGMYSKEDILGDWYIKNPKKYFRKLPRVCTRYEFTYPGYSGNSSTITWITDDDYVESDYRYFDFEIVNNTIIMNYETTEDEEEIEKIKIISVEKGILTLKIKGKELMYNPQ